MTSTSRLHAEGRKKNREIRSGPLQRGQKTQLFDDFCHNALPVSSYGLSERSCELGAELGHAWAGRPGYGGQSVSLRQGGRPAIAPMPDQKALRHHSARCPDCSPTESFSWPIAHNERSQCPPAFSCFSPPPTASVMP